jgi:hypothetical protein
MTIARLGRVLAAVAAVCLGAGAAHAAVLQVDDDGGNCIGAAYTTISAAVAAAQTGDVIQICPGTYDEQLIVDKDVRLLGLPDGDATVTLRPTALPATRPSALGGKPVLAGVIVDGANVLIDRLDIDLSAAGVSSCGLYAGVYYRNANGTVRNGSITGVAVDGHPGCESGVGLYVESGEIGQRLGVPVYGKAKVAAVNMLLANNQKGGIAGNGPQTLVKVVGGEIVGAGSSAGAVQNGVQVAIGAKGRMVNTVLRDFASMVSGKTATALLAYRANRLVARRIAIDDGQTGAFAVDSRTKVQSSHFGNLARHGIVFLSRKCQASGNELDGVGEVGVFVNGNTNLVRGGVMANMPLGLVFYGGTGNSYNGITFDNVPVETSGSYSGAAAVSANNVAPFVPLCLTAADCDDGLDCTIDGCTVATGECTHLATCDDGNPCTDDLCTASGCINVNNTAACNDGNGCTMNDKCSGGVCAGGVPAVCDDGLTCTFDACSTTLGCVNLPACNDHNPCTIDLCDEVNGCSNTVAPNGTPCPDGNPCNGAETCQAGICTAGVPPSCNDGNPCTADTCDLVQGCKHTPVTNNTPCSDGNFCNGAETCQAGLCRTGTTPSCNDGNACTTDTCDAVSGCVHTPIAGCVSCTTNADCNDSNPCTADLCSGGACTNPVLPNNTPCPDGTVCNGTELCQGGSCTAGTALNCNDGNPCTTDTCDAVTGCAHAPVADGTGCPDATLCNGAETCIAGICVAGTPLNCNDGNPCTADVCLPVSGCQNTAVPNGTPCADGTVCNGAEVCQAGTCTAGTPLNCNDGNPCTVDSCDPVTGCHVTAVPDLTSCADATVCNGAEVCLAGACLPGTPLDCNDGNACTVDACDAIGGCTHTPIAGCQPCTTAGDCNDGNPCTVDSCVLGSCQNATVLDGSSCADANVCNGTEICVAGACVPGTPLACDDGNACTVDACDPVVGCTGTPVANGTACDDLTVCNGHETCQAGVCTAGTPPVCNDGNPCTLDLCNAVSGCQSTPLADGTLCTDANVCNGTETCVVGLCTPGAALVCDDGNPCTTDSCDPASGCQATPVADFTACGDGDACNGAETCQGGTCTGGTPLNCNDGNACTTDVCDVVSGCINTPIVGCQSCTTAGDCADGNPCTVDACNAGVCSNTPAANGTSCDDGTVCNGTETCQAGLCMPGTPLVCDDGNVCTADSCDAVTGCIHTPTPGCQPCTVAADCADANPCTTDACNGGMCSNTAVANGTSCADATVCNGAETCQAGTCTAGTPLVCDDGNACTTDSCDAVAGCLHTPIAGCTPCVTAGDCADGNACTTDACSAGVCSNTPVANGTSCADATVCNGAETCQAGTCTAGTPLVCDDGNECTTDSCDAVLGCLATPVLDNTPCNGGLGLCTGGICL